MKRIIAIPTNIDFYRCAIGQLGLMRILEIDTFVLVAIILFLLLLIILLFINLTKLKQRNYEINNFNQLRKTFIDADNRLIYLKDKNLKYIFANKALEKFYDKQLSEIIGSDDFILTDPEFAEKQRKTDLDVLEKNILIEDQLEWQNNIYKMKKFPVKLLNGYYGVGAYIEDVTEKKEQIEKIEYLSFHDPLTGLYNRSFFEEEMRRLDTDRNLPISVIVGDVNGLKLANDIFGHDAGDELLREVANTFQKVCRSDDIIVRIGGDEFAILLPKTQAKHAKEIMNRIKEEFSKQNIKAVKGSISMGCDAKVDKQQDILQVIKNAEDRMYSEKVLDRNHMRNISIENITDVFYKISPREKQHSRNVSQICEDIGKAMNLSEIEIRRLKEAGYFHDIGKIALDESLLNKDDELTQQEWKEMKEHPIVGYRILNSFDNTLDLAEYVLAHQERWDGTGYPKGLKGEEVPRLARIIALAESYDKMVNPLFSKEPMTKQQAVREIQKYSGTRFDPEIVDVFVKMIG